jgi:hypothetical protein
MPHTMRPGRLYHIKVRCQQLVVSQAESTGINRVFFRLAALLVVAWPAMRPPRALPVDSASPKKSIDFFSCQFILTNY